MHDATRLDACVGYFSLRGWRELAASVDTLEGTHACRVLVGMNVQSPDEELRDLLYQQSFEEDSSRQLLDSKAFQRRKREMADRFREQLTIGTPNNTDESALRRLARQLRANKVQVKLYTRHPLHAKLYLVHQKHRMFPAIGFLGSSNLTLSGLSKQGELNVDVKDDDAAIKLLAWFDERWNDSRAVDISAELAAIIEESWAREELVPPYHVYLKIAWHLSRDARKGLDDFRIPAPFTNMLYDFQAAAVKIAARHLHTSGGVMIGDVVGLGKTLMACALAKIRNETGEGVLIICPKNLESMWKWHCEEYGLIAKVVPTSMAQRELPNLRFYHLVIIDESHNLRNPEGKTYAAIKDYIDRGDKRVILLSATPYNKQYTDLSAQLRLFVSPDGDLGIRPEAAIAEEGGVVGFGRRHPQIKLNRLGAFEQSTFASDWQDLMRKYLVRRTRTFIKNHYARDDGDGQKYLLKDNGDRAYFPDRVPRNVVFATTHNGQPTTYSRLVSSDVVDRIDALLLPRYGLSEYLVDQPERIANAPETRAIENLSRAGARLKGFTRTNLFKRLESGGDAFLLSLKRHAIRNLVFLHALENGLDIPIGTTNARDLNLDDIHGDEDPEALDNAARDIEEELDNPGETSDVSNIEGVVNRNQYHAIAEQTYHRFATAEKHRFTWLRSRLFGNDLAAALRHDAGRILEILELAGRWKPAEDLKLARLRELLNEQHPTDKVLIFTQYADTAHYLHQHLRDTVPGTVEVVTGGSGNPTTLAQRFSPNSNEIRKRVPDEIRVLITTDVLSEGQNLQDAHIVVNYDLPWAIIRLIQRVGRIDRIGQNADTITCYSFLPDKGVEEIIRLRERVRQRLTENAEVVGADERFFEDDGSDENQKIVELFNEEANVLEEDDGEGEVDLSSQALQIWQEAITGNPSLKKIVEGLPPLIYASKFAELQDKDTGGALAYIQMNDGADMLIRVDETGDVVSQAPLAILRAAACAPDTPALERSDAFHGLVSAATRKARDLAATSGSGLGSTRGVRYRLYNRLKSYQDHINGNLLTPDDHRQVVPQLVTALLRGPVLESATQTLNREMRSGINDEELADLCIRLHADDRLVGEAPTNQRREPTIICSMELRASIPY